MAICVCVYVRIHIHALTHAGTLSLPFSIDIANSLIATLYAELHACEWTNEFWMNILFWFHTFSFVQLTYPSFDTKSGQSAVLNDGTSDRDNSFGRHAHCANTNVDGEAFRMNVFRTKWTEWEAVAGVSVRKVPIQKHFSSFSQRGPKPWMLCWIKLFKIKRKTLQSSYNLNRCFLKWNNKTLKLISLVWKYVQILFTYSNKYCLEFIKVSLTLFIIILTKDFMCYLISVYSINYDKSGSMLENLT